MNLVQNKPIESGNIFSYILIAEEMIRGKRENASAQRRVRYNSAYSLDAEVDDEASAPEYFTDSPDVILEKKERYCQLCHALNSLPEIQGRRIDAHFILGISQKEIAEVEGVCISSVNESIKRGVKAMKKYIQNNSSTSPNPCHLNLLHSERT